MVCERCRVVHRQLAITGQVRVQMGQQESVSRSFSRKQCVQRLSAICA